MPINAPSKEAAEAGGADSEGSSRSDCQANHCASKKTCQGTGVFNLVSSRAASNIGSTLRGVFWGAWLAWFEAVQQPKPTVVLLAIEVGLTGCGENQNAPRRDLESRLPLIDRPAILEVVAIDLNTCLGLA